MPVFQTVIGNDKAKMQICSLLPYISSGCLCLQPEAYRAVIAEADLHICAETACGRPVPALPQGRDQRIEKFLPGFRVCGRAETRPVALPRIGRQRELRYQQYFALYLADTQIHAPICISKYPVAEQTLGEPVRLWRCVAFFHTHQHQQTGINCGYAVAIYLDPGRTYPLQETNHCVSLYQPRDYDKRRADIMPPLECAGSQSKLAP